MIYAENTWDCSCSASNSVELTECHACGRQYEFKHEGYSIKEIHYDEMYELENIKLKRQNKIMREALEYTANQVTWIDNNNQVVILTYGYCVEVAQKALKQAEEVDAKGN